MLVKLQRWFPVTLVIGMIVLLSLVVIAIGPASDAGAHGDPTPTAEPGDTPEEGDGHDDEAEVTAEEQALIDAGYEVYLAAGCAVCHGENAEGTDLAPALAGHSDAAVRRQVRAPTGSMPVYPPEKISETELDALVAYITHLGGEDDHPHPDGELEPLITQHLWMTLYVLADEDAENVDDALHHVRHIIDLVEEPQREIMEEVERDLLAGDIHEAEHTIEAMLADAEPGPSPNLIHLQLALAAVRVEDEDEATHHLEHFLETATGAQNEQGEEILALVEDGELAEAEHRLEEVIEETLAQGDQESSPADDHTDTENPDDHGS